MVPGTALLRISDELSDEEATPINCGVATMVADGDADPDGRCGGGARVGALGALRVCDGQEPRRPVGDGIEDLNEAFRRASERTVLRAAIVP